MAFVKKTWKDRIAEFPTRRRLTKSNGDSELVTVSREEGTLSQEGDAFSAENMNDLERRVDDAISEINSNLNALCVNTFNTETVIGNVGEKKLYRKSICIKTSDGSAFASNKTITFNFSDIGLPLMSEIDDIFKIDCHSANYSKNGDLNIIYPLGSQVSNALNAHYGINFIMQNNIIYYYQGDYVMNANRIYITIEYTRK